MGNKILNNILSFTLFIISFILVGLGFNLFIDINFFTSTSILFTIIFSLSSFIVFMILPNKINKIFYNLLFYIFLLLNITQILHYKILGTFYKLNDLGLIFEGSNYVGSALQNITFYLIIFVIVAIFINLLTNYVMKKFNRNYDKYLYLILLILVLIITILGYIVNFNIKATKGNNNDIINEPTIYDSYTNFSNSNKTMEICGIYQYVVRSVYLTIENVISFDIGFMRNKIKNHFKVMDKNKESNYTGKFEDKNLIYIMMESIDNWLITEEIMPTLYKLQNEGINFENNYTPIYGNGRTMNTEFALNTGMYQHSNNLLFRYYDNKFPLSLPNVFKNKGYDVNSIHYNNGSFYDRNNLHKTLGYSKHYALKDMGYSNMEDDRNLIKNNDVYNLIVNKKQKFMTFLITYSAHLPYINNNGLCITKDKDEQLSCLKKQARITDDFIKELILKLDNDNLLKDTVLVLYTDHYSYGYNKISDHKKIVNKQDIDKTPFIIWNKGIGKETISTYTSSIDAIPIIANLFKLDVDLNRYLGVDTLTNRDNNVYFSDGTYLGDNIATISAFDRIKINDYILETNYYK